MKDNIVIISLCLISLILVLARLSQSDVDYDKDYPCYDLASTMHPWCMKFGFNPFVNLVAITWNIGAVTPIVLLGQIMC